MPLSDVLLKGYYDVVLLNGYLTFELYFMEMLVGPLGVPFHLASWEGCLFLQCLDFLFVV